MVTVLLSDIEKAAGQHRDVILRTQCSLSHYLTERTGADVYVKYENKQYTGSFKVRGALTKLLTLSEEQRSRGVVAMSAGNHAQGVAYNAELLGVRATIVMPDSTPFTKIRNTTNLGAKVVIQGATLKEAAEHADLLASDQGLTFIHPFNDEHVIAGQGTIVLEMLGDVPELDIIIVPVGGGGLIAGCAVAAKSTRPAMEVFGVETESYPSLTNALTGGSRPCSGSTLAEGIAVAEIGNIPFPLIKENVDKVLTVSESAIESAVAMFALHDKVVAEGAGAAGLAAILEYPQYFSEKKVGLILCGGNIDSRMLSSVLMRNMVRYGQVVTLSIAMPDKPGQLHTVSGICAEAGANVLAVEHSRFAMDLAASSARLDITIETKDQEHAEEVIQNIKSEGFLVSVKELTK